MSSTISVIDLFAGPGGLAEGFFAFKDDNKRHPFKISMSVEKEASAHRTLELRSFFRSFGGEIPRAYYDYVQGAISREELFQKFPAHASMARSETFGQPLELGRLYDDGVVLRAIRQSRRKSSKPTVVIGGPPCQAYSIVGRARSRGIVGYRPEKDRRHFLYKEYLKILTVARPAIFVMENVKGILSSQVNGSKIFPRILDDLSNPSHAMGVKSGPRYRIYSLVDRQLDLSDLIDKNYVIESELYGIPQTRHRVILLGIQEDIKGVPLTLRQASRTFTVADAIRDLPVLRSGLTEEDDSPELWHSTMQEIGRRVASDLTADGLRGTTAREAVRRAQNLKQRGALFVGGVQKKIRDAYLRSWFEDDQLEGYLNHEARMHMSSDLERYLYCACYAQLNGGLSPRSFDIPRRLAPQHKNWKSGHFVDRFKVQSSLRPASTITSHIAKDGHYFIHYDPAQCRSLTVREAARLQTFPDNYFFEGNRTQQFTQVGNAVPPLLALQIADIAYRAFRA